ncbi:MAG: hypothetical protein ICV69_10725 [Thermoleophilaceae bacterium]|nr:hypothetical protein [Thermoleophilaceae bacterium]
MAVEIRPVWDRSETVSVRVCEQRGELIVRAGGERMQFVLREERRGRIHWVERAPGRRGARNVPVSVGDVVCHCLREWDAEQRVIELSLGVAARAHRRGGRWERAAKRLAGQAHAARRRESVSTLPFQILFQHQSDPEREGPLTPSLAAERIGYHAGGRPDTSRLLRRLGLADQRDGSARKPRRQRSVGYRTGPELCRAIDVDPVELGSERGGRWRSYSPATRSPGGATGSSSSPMAGAGC